MILSVSIILLLWVYKYTLIQILNQLNTELGFEHCLKSFYIHFVVVSAILIAKISFFYFSVSLWYEMFFVF